MCVCVCLCVCGGGRRGLKRHQEWSRGEEKEGEAKRDVKLQRNKADRGG